MAMMQAVGAPRVEVFAPLRGSSSSQFFEWLEGNWSTAEDRLARLVAKWRPLAGFIEVNFFHPTHGPSGALVLLVTTVDVTRRVERVARLEVIPHREVEPYVPEWRRGETVLVHVEDMPADLRRRYATTRVRWSLNAPVMAGGEWVGLVGAVADDRGFTGAATDSFSGLARLFTAEIAAAEALKHFTEDVGNRLPRLVR